MIQINLLPTVKADFVKAQKNKRLMISISIIVILLCSLILALLTGIVYGAQKFKLNSTEKQIKNLTAEIQSKQDLDKVLTIQEQIKSIDSLHAQKPIATRLTGFIEQTTPKDVTLSTYNIDFKNFTANLEGSAPDQPAVNRLVDTLKFAEFKIDPTSADSERAFSEVTLTSFDVKDGEVNYGISVKFNNQLFDSANQNIVLLVPKDKVTSVSSTQQPSELFKEIKKEEQ
jgi:uncharacterized membrane protein YciS (DUF1049 family)